jgi:hypothetical protein
MVLVPLGSDARTRAYVARRTAEGRSTAEIMRALKRYVARETYRDHWSWRYKTSGECGSGMCGAGADARTLLLREALAAYLGSVGPTAASSAACPTSPTPPPR